ncbi:MAG: DUF4286 family protein [Steroidobacteraceae bacterium]
MSSILTYEVECQLDPDVVADYDAWLPGHIRDVLACAGFLGATIEAPQTAPGEPQRRLIRYRLESAAALDHYLENNATRLRTETAQRFGSRVNCARRIVRPRQDLLSAELEPHTCLNCGAAVTGRHCAECGQSGDVHLLTMHEVSHDFVHSVLHLDGRVWRTLRTLVLRPGELTREYVAGRREHYLPPFRLYLVISILFFALSALLPGDSLFQINDTGDEAFAPIVIDPGGKAAEGMTAPLKEAIDDLPPEARRKLAAAVEAQRDAEPCTIDVPPVFGVSWNEPLARACKRIRADGGVQLAERFAATAPKLMFMFLPLMAAVALLFYWRPRRLYAEHLVLFVHNHAFTFLLVTVTQILDAITLLEVPFIGLLGFVNFLLFLYLFYYVFRSMRVVYGEGRARTVFKFIALLAIYLVLLAVTMMAGLLYSVLSLS